MCELCPPRGGGNSASLPRCCCVCLPRRLCLGGGCALFLCALHQKLRRSQREAKQSSAAAPSAPRRKAESRSVSGGNSSSERRTARGGIAKHTCTPVRCVPRIPVYPPSYCHRRVSPPCPCFPVSVSAPVMLMGSGRQARCVHTAHGTRGTTRHGTTRHMSTTAAGSGGTRRTHQTQPGGHASPPAPCSMRHITRILRSVGHSRLAQRRSVTTVLTHNTLRAPDHAALLCNRMATCCSASSLLPLFAWISNDLQRTSVT